MKWFVQPSTSRNYTWEIHNSSCIYSIRSTLISSRSLLQFLCQFKTLFISIVYQNSASFEASFNYSSNQIMFVIKIRRVRLLKNVVFSPPRIRWECQWQPLFVLRKDKMGLDYGVYDQPSNLCWWEYKDDTSSKDFIV